MKRIAAITLSAILMLTFFAACGKKKEEMKDDIKEELTTIRDDVSDAEDDVSDAVDEGKNDSQGMMDDLTENGNVTNQTGEGALQEALTDISEMLEGDGNKDDTTKNDTTR